MKKSRRNRHGQTKSFGVPQSNGLKTELEGLALSSELKSQTVAIISHVYAPGPPHELESYLKEKVHRLYFIAHPLDFVKKKPSSYRYHEDGLLKYDKKGITWPLPSLLIYLKDVIANLYWGLFVMPKTDLVIALDNINAASALILRALGKTKTVVFYTIDYIPNRFHNKILNNFYHWLDSTAVRRSDYVWNLSPVMVTMRRKKGVEDRYIAKQLTVPIGTHILPIESVKKDPNLVIFMGHLRAGQGADLLLEAMAEVHVTNPKIKLRLIGGGALETELNNQAESLKIDKIVEFTGFVPSNEAMRQMLLEGTIAVAPYSDDPASYTQYTDPGKPKEYLAAGLPVIMTKVVAFAETIEKRKAGLAVPYTKKAIADAIIKLIESPDIAGYQRRAKELAAESTWNVVFTHALDQMKY